MCFQYIYFLCPICLCGTPKSGRCVLLSRRAQSRADGEDRFDESVGFDTVFHAPCLDIVGLHEQLDAGSGITSSVLYGSSGLDD